MAVSIFTLSLLISLVLLFSNTHSSIIQLPQEDSPISVPECDIDLLEFPLNFEYLQAEFFLRASVGHGLDKVAPNLSMGGPPPRGARRANLDPLTRDIITQFAHQDIGHLRAIKSNVQGFPRPLMDLSPRCFAAMMDEAFGHPLQPAFDPYANNINFLLASYLLPYVGLTGYVGINPGLKGALSRRLVAGLLGMQSAQDAVIRTLLYERGMMKVQPYDITVSEFTKRISDMRNRLGGTGVKDKGIIVPPVMGPEEKHPGCVLAGDRYAVAYERTPREILRILYGKDTAHSPGGFFPDGANGKIARGYLHSD
ncbi:ferritin-like catalase Nec2 [Tasmannia lanceolata]|uniref:ferritin-like catalase Nec2 n=1 Tax=Tasmannia lanceolata TaxID=3420 RepID=UPI0040636776